MSVIGYLLYMYRVVPCKQGCTTYTAKNTCVLVLVLTSVELTSVVILIVIVIYCEL